MPRLGAPELLSIWEEGRSRHPIDRALLLFAVAQADLPPECLADLPLGRCSEALLRWRRSVLGPRIPVYANCPGCREQMEMTLETEQLLADVATEYTEYESDGFRCRAPTSRDLAEAVEAGDHDAVVMRLLERCCLSRPDDASPDALAVAEASLETLDPAADIELALTCASCGMSWTAPFDIGVVLWDELEVKARSMLSEVHILARAYGWSERDILGLSEARRTEYIERIAI